MYKIRNFKKKLMATAVASALVSGNHVVQAQADGTVEEVVVTGIRASLQRSMDQKREADGVVDVITAEDIGKFPDTNLAESLQRIPGVSIDRSGGEGTRIAVRGLPSEYNLVTQNGRTIARTTGGRGFDFANIASEMVSAVSIAKTSNATLDSGGMGSTVDIRTVRPLNSPGMKAVVSGKGMLDQSSADETLTPEIFGLFSNTFADDTIGVSFSAAYQERQSGSKQAEVGTGWRSFDGIVDQDWSGTNAQWGGVPKTGQVNRPTDDEIYSVPQTTIYRFYEEERERLNGQLVLQWAPTETVKATLDYDFYTRTVNGHENDISAWFTFAPSNNVWSDGPVGSPLIYSESYGTPQDMSMAAAQNSNKYEGDTVGLNVEWDVSNSLKLSFDMALSDAERSPDSNLGSRAMMSTAAFIRTSATTDFTGDIPSLIVGGGNAITPADMQVTGGVIANERDKSYVDQYQLKGNYEFNDIHSIDFGIASTEISNHTQNVNVQRNDWGGVGQAGDLADVFVGTEGRVQSRFNGSFGNFSAAQGLTTEGIISNNTLADGTQLVAANRQDVMFMYNYADARRAAEALYNTPAAIAASPTVGDCGDGVASIYCPSYEFYKGNDRKTVETTEAFYLQYNLKLDTAMPFEAHLGVRHEQTDVYSVSQVVGYDLATWIADTEVELRTSGRDSQSGRADYSHTLPNLDLSLEVMDGVIVRASASKTIGRAGYDQLQGGTTVGSLANRGGGSGTSGNPALKPLESENIDVSAEWYFDDASYVSLGYFKKDVTNFIEYTNTEVNLWGILNPADANSPKVAQAIAATGSADAATIRNWIRDNLGDEPGVVVTGTGQLRISGVTGDAPMIFDITTLQNGDFERTIDGWELAVQHMFGESGFGVMANYTKAESDDLEFDNFVLTNQVAMTGLSDTYNIVGIYENYGVSTRLAYNYRDEFLSQAGTATGPNPVYVEGYGQFDLTVSYDLTEDLQLMFQGINITDEAVRTHGRSESEVINYQEFGSRWMIGASYSF